MLAEKICSIFNYKQTYVKDPAWIIEHFSPDTVAAIYENLFVELINKKY